MLHRKTTRLAISVGALMVTTLISSSAAWAMSSSYSQAPALAAMVAAGDLPALVDRLPADPFVLTPIEEVGQYGGTWRSALKGAGDNGWLRRTLAYEPLVSYTIGWDGVVPNLASSFESNEDGTEYVFKLREGHKWSDGTPFTAEDIVYGYSVFQHPEYRGRGNRPFIEDATVTAVDATTVKFTFEEPNGLFLQNMASVNAMYPLMYQKAYCSQYDIDFNSEADANAKAAGLSGWAEALYLACDIDNWGDENRPTLQAWMPVTPYDGLSQLIKFERNPYYFKVDTAGNQLPYIDNLEMKQTESTEDIVLQALNGEIDFQNRHIATLDNKGLFIDGQENGGYRLYETVAASMNTVTIELNQTSLDPVLNEIFNQRDFRVALSVAINRPELIDLLFVGQGEPYQAAPRPGSRWYNEQLATQYLEYDPDQANALLDGLGYTERDGDGFRLDPDGNRIAFRLDTTSDFRPYFPDAGELLKRYWAAVGVDLDVRVVERSFLFENYMANLHDMHIWVGDGGLGDALLDPRYYLPFNEGSAYGIRWAKTLSDPSSPDAVTPPAELARQQDLYRELTRSANVDKQDELFNEILSIAADEFRVMGVSLPAPGYGIVSTRMGNVPNNMPQAWIYPSPGPMSVSQLFYKSE